MSTNEDLVDNSGPSEIPGAKRRMLNDRSGMTIDTSAIADPSLTADDLDIKIEDNMEGRRVLLLRNLAPSVVAQDVESFVSPFTRTAQPKIYLQFAASQAFVEFGTPQEATDAYRFFKAHPSSLKGQPVQIYFSERESVTAPDDKNSNFRVLLATVTNLMYPVDIELIRFLFTRFGHVQKIISFSKFNSASTFQALVEMADPPQAMIALKELHGRNIYDGCNTLQIQPSRLPELVVRVNNSRAWDYTVAPEGLQPTRGVPTEQRPPRITADAMKSRMQFAAQTQDLVTPSQGCFDENKAPMNAVSGNARYNSPGFLKVLSMARLPREAREWKQSMLAQSTAPSSVLIVYNLTPNVVTVTELFNVFSLYGVLQRIKILRDKPHTALLQYSDPLYASLAAHFLQGAPLFDVEPGIQIGFSRNAEVTLPNTTGLESQRRTRAFLPQDQRYTPSEVEKFIRAACPPTCTLFIANLKENVEESEIRDLLRPYGEVTKVQLRSPPDGSRRRYAMIEMSNRNEALFALAHLHNTSVDGAHIKVAFSKVVISDAASANPEIPPATGHVIDSSSGCSSSGSIRPSINASVSGNNGTEGAVNAATILN